MSLQGLGRKPYHDASLLTRNHCKPSMRPRQLKTQHLLEQRPRKQIDQVREVIRRKHYPIRTEGSTSPGLPLLLLAHVGSVTGGPRQFLQVKITLDGAILNGPQCAGVARDKVAVMHHDQHGACEGA